MRPRASLLLLALSLSCGGSQQKTSWSDNRKNPQSEHAEEPKVPVLENRLGWARETLSPRLGSHEDPELDELVKICGKNDTALSEVASELARISVDRGSLPSLDEVSFLLKKRGAPYVAPRLWTASVEGASVSILKSELEKFSRARSKRGLHLCGFGIARTKDGFTAIALDAETFAFVKPVITSAAAGERPSLEVDLLEDASLVEVVVLPPSGGPRHLHGKLSGRTFRAELRFFERGPHLVQLLATLEGGPMPIAAFLVTSDDTPPDFFESRDVPGEKNFEETNDRDASLLQLVNGARRESGLPAVRMHPVLSEVARAHTELMRKQGRISHDAGDGTPATRVEAKGLKPRATGENVALAPSVVRLHRALWASPSHRENLLLSRWNHIGISIVEDDRGGLYATELFADLPE